MAFGITRRDLQEWKQAVSRGEIAFLTHYWYDERFPECHTVTKVGSNSLPTLIAWGNQYGLLPKWIHQGTYPHFDLLGSRQYDILLNEGLVDHINQFKLRRFDEYDKTGTK